MKFQLAFLVSLFFFDFAYAEGEWSKYEPLYADTKISIEVSFQLFQHSCDQGGRLSKFRYRITGEFRSSEYYVNWKMDYVDCNGKLYYQTNSLNIGINSKAGNGIVDMLVRYPQDAEFTCSSLENHFYDVEGSHYAASGIGIKSPLVLSEPSNVETRNLNQSTFTSKLNKGGNFNSGDSDGDGIIDKEDKCIQTPGPKENLGCPWPDQDRDGVFDKDDACPTIGGAPENKGCPRLEKKELETIRYTFENLEFETGTDIILTHSFPSLNALAALLVKKSNYGLKIEGHTDNVGSYEKNMILSQKRADAVKKYLVKRGVSATYLETYGYGETKPIATNETTAGKQKNRRVEMTITFH